jgi:hypothetical protein
VRIDPNTKIKKAKNTNYIIDKKSCQVDTTTGIAQFNMSAVNSKGDKVPNSPLYTITCNDKGNTPANPLALVKDFLNTQTAKPPLVFNAPPPDPMDRAVVRDSNEMGNLRGGNSGGGGAQ